MLNDLNQNPKHKIHHQILIYAFLPLMLVLIVWLSCISQPVFAGYYSDLLDTLPLSDDTHRYLRSHYKIGHSLCYAILTIFCININININSKRNFGFWILNSGLFKHKAKSQNSELSLEPDQDLELNLKSEIQNSKFPPHYFLVLLLVFSLGALLEIVQYFIPTRAASFVDLGYNLVGVIAGTAIIWGVKSLTSKAASRSQK